MFPPLMRFFSSSASFLNCLLTFCLLPEPRRTITSTAKPPPQLEVISPSRFDRPILTFNPLDIESAERLSDPADNDTSGARINHPYWKRIGKIVMVVGLGWMGMAMTLMVNALAAATAHRDFCIAYMVIVYLVLLIGMGLSHFSVAMTGSPYVGWVQRRLMFLTHFLVIASCFLRIHFTLPIVGVYLVASRVLAGVALICLYVCLA
ncbi:hypothetical protein AXF42_Ash021535 [Apostasia shenzhenica]|uniref:Uncharacterized protein n=1 Tax=Apostasia shenzhenica TaxID=1088818 RepID=A0A2H9ZR26_9ASPA|nr:hypothetical protein AXF42_Ash021535 [Apostasia shenzhenica]